MNKVQKQFLMSLFPEVRFSEVLANHCTFRIGGPADAFIEIKKLETRSRENLTSLFKFLNKSKIPFFVLGGGSNVLFNDKGFRGVVIKITANEILIKSDQQNWLEASSGVNLQFLTKQANEKGFQNLLQFAGIPGTLGGAVRGNAGANGIEIKDVLVSAKILNTKTGAIKTFTNKQLKFTYRNSYIKKNPHLIVLSAKLKLQKFSKKEAEEKCELIAKLSNRRKETQPWGLSAGSFFKNPNPSNHPTLTSDQFKAGYLIDQCGLKGTRIGGAIISEKHANFFQNLNDPLNPATQKDILALATKARKAVYKKFKIRLEEEVQIVPRFSKLPKKLKK